MSTAEKAPWLCAGYVRVSRRDGDKSESDSIENQRRLISDFVAQQPDIRLCGFYSDDDYTGTNFDRPAFGRMLEDIKSGKINCVAVKDLSRFGRDYIGVGSYLQRIFPGLGVRFVAITDDIDSARRAYDMMMPVKNIFNEQYARDISRKVLTTLSVKQRAGQFIGAFASYGYFKDPENRGRLIVDEYAAQVVRKIYALFLEGNGKSAIARILNDGGILCPSEYKRSLNMKYKNANRLESTSYWTYGTVNSILKNEMYTGKMVQHRADRSRYSARGCLDRSQWLVVPDMHEAIISEETWSAAQLRLSRRARQIEPGKGISPFAGYIFCADCGRAMSKACSGGRERYVCGTYKRCSKKLCPAHRVFCDELESAVLCAINGYIKSCTQAKSYIDQKLGRLLRDREKCTARELSELEGRLEKSRRLSFELYGDYKSGLISREEYADFRRQSEKAALELSGRIRLLENAAAPKNPPEELLKLRGEMILERVTCAAVAAFFERITVFEDGSLRFEYRFSQPEQNP